MKVNEAKECVSELVKRAKAAQAVFEGYDQRQVDAIVRAAGKVIYDNAEILGQEAVEESKLGVLAGKIAKQRKVTMGAWEYLKDKKSVGVIEDDTINCVRVVAKPMGVVCCVTPSTNPTSTVGGNAMQVFKCRNAMIVAPHPIAKKCTAHGVSLIRGELKKLGAPEDLIQIIEEPTIEKTQELMSQCDVVVATGGFGMVKAAYSSGRPSYGVGQGNVQAILDRGYTNYEKFAKTVIANRCFDNGMPCTGEQTLHIPAELETEVLQVLEANGCYIVEDAATIEKIRDTIFVDGILNRAVVGKTGPELVQIFGLDKAPADTKIVLLKNQAYGDADLLCREILTPVIRYTTYEKFEDAVAGARATLLVEGAGHTATIYSHDETHIAYAANILPVCRVLVEQPGAGSGGSAYNNGLVPTISIGCGTWGNNAISDNLNYIHLMNKTRVSYIIPDAVEKTPEEIWGE